MTTIRKHLVTAFAALSMGALSMGAHAQATGQAQAPEGRYSHAEHQQKRAEFAAKRAEFAARRAAKLHDELKITPAQEAAWNAFVASMKPAARHADGQRPGPHFDRSAWAKLSAPQRMEKHIEMQKRRTAAMEQRLGALNSFYAVLTPEQKKTFDEKAARLQGHGGKHRGMRGNWQQRGHGDTARG